MGYLLEIDKYSAISLGGGFSLSYKIINNSGIKMPIISFGDDVALLSTIITEDNTSIVTNLKNKIILSENYQN